MRTNPITQNSKLKTKNFFSVVSRSAAETRKWGTKLGQLLKGGEVIGLTGELGSGKTCFVRGLAEGLEVSREAWIRSPSFTLINEYEGRVPIYHIDLYRIGSSKEMEELNLREYLFSDGVSVIEWFEHLSPEEIDEYLHVRFAYADAHRRRLTFTAYGNRYDEIVRSLRERVQG
ncbi:MAG: tRNA (adenosine(37)-N6)-threonylcarbamoyltransferase complex ATPase subunit type 1 TsaE [Deltaproteobacteria bacterium GWA2_57_13]|nr:MAG: tRNA (adenosine(37)-N6)-threonylcarbamoyltransferase complex ATPase subunit type 1 TsaE [Deltaproteobacteria bacterium GWA2_57_13]OGQ48667.1 MAG: tRNA (adenosine(37)-N6)-threonylcarbamoyltransferase complex ATPase subunit type 1 TsaE [Deltaproteobacteria bacterium RIFCSPLOWO2_02_FULL_57_26]OGQ84996.1 MAG: tRNA (adenosine(37)-N6)-threonylcarbamoyltransferase complex ATPase subunit type 1 TsaE [Deltaproteobacteria bacterium RIFCSPLOWO2_12_FULL_57_22]